MLLQVLDFEDIFVEVLSLDPSVSLLEVWLCVLLGSLYMEAQTATFSATAPKIQKAPRHPYFFSQY